jgi:ATP-dependent Lon protease
MNNNPDTDNSDDDVIMYTKPTWKRERIKSEDYTVDEKKNNAINTFIDLSNNNIDMTVAQVLRLYKVSFATTKDSGIKWFIEEVDRMISSSRNPDIMRVRKVCNDLKSMIGYGYEDDEEMDEDEEDEMEEEEDCGHIEIDMGEETANILLALFAASKKMSEREDTNPKNSKPDNLSKFKKLLVNFDKGEKEDDTLKFFKDLPPEKQEYYLNIISTLQDKISNQATNDLPYLLKLVDFDIDDSTKQTIFNNVTSFGKLSPSSGEYNKRKNLINAIKRLPFSKKSKEVDTSQFTEEVGTKRRRGGDDKNMKRLQSIEANLNKAIYGHKETKNQTMRLIASMFANDSSQGGQCFALCGPPGTGKTQIAGEIAKALGRPFAKLNMGGASGGDDLLGHGYTYEGSTYGIVARALMDAKCNKCVMLIDELDKVSQTEKGREIINVLVHMTDSTQNMSFQDKYLAGINIDLSKVVMIFSFNDSSSISPILLDRMKIIRVGGYKINDKVVIAKKHLIPSIKKELGHKDCNYTFEDLIIRDMINQYTFEGGVRKLKELITDILMEINLRKMTGQKVGGSKITNNMVITKSIIRDDIFKERHYVQHTMASKVDQVGLVNGLWANCYGIGGLIPIEAHLIPTASKFELQLTGMQGDVMKESMSVAKTVAWRLLPESRKTELMKSWKDDGPTGIHIHCPDGSTPKDGPSAGGAITTCLVSLLMGKKVNQSYAMTGEINLKGDITEIGGLEEKVFGAITAGIKTILYPFENKRDYEKIKEKFPEIFLETSASYIKMIPIKKIEEIIDIVFV